MRQINVDLLVKDGQRKAMVCININSRPSPEFRSQRALGLGHGFREMIVFTRGKPDEGVLVAFTPAKTTAFGKSTEIWHTHWHLH